MNIRNWKRFQHFKNRRPPWIKLYREILDDLQWHELPGDAAKTLVSLWLIASEGEAGQLPDLKTLSFRLRVPEKKLKDTISMLSHWVEQRDIYTISERNQNDPSETERETERETEAADAVAISEKPKPETDIQRIVKGWKVLTGIPIEGPESSAWDKVHFSRCSKSAKSLIELFGDRVNALRCMELVYNEMTRKKLTCTIETIVKHSDLYREKLAKQEVA